MADVIHLHCRHCGEALHDREASYCPSCNIYLAYRAMPFLLGMMLTGRLANNLAEHYPHGLPPMGCETASDEEEEALIWE